MASIYINPKNKPTSIPKGSAEAIEYANRFTKPTGSIPESVKENPIYIKRGGGGGGSSGGGGGGSSTPAPSPASIKVEDVVPSIPTPQAQTIKPATSSVLPPQGMSGTIQDIEGFVDRRSRVTLPDNYQRVKTREELLYGETPSGIIRRGTTLQDQSPFYSYGELQAGVEADRDYKVLVAKGEFGKEEFKIRADVETKIQDIYTDIQTKVDKGEIDFGSGQSAYKEKTEELLKEYEQRLSVPQEQFGKEYQKIYSTPNIAAPVIEKEQLIETGILTFGGPLGALTLMGKESQKRDLIYNPKTGEFTEPATSKEFLYGGIAAASAVSMPFKTLSDIKTGTIEAAQQSKTVTTKVITQQGDDLLLTYKTKTLPSDTFQVTTRGYNPLKIKGDEVKLLTGKAETTFSYVDPTLEIQKGYAKAWTTTSNVYQVSGQTITSELGKVTLQRGVVTGTQGGLTEGIITSKDSITRFRGIGKDVTTIPKDQIVFSNSGKAIKVKEGTVIGVGGTPEKFIYGLERTIKQGDQYFKVVAFKEGGRWAGPIRDYSTTQFQTLTPFKVTDTTTSGTSKLLTTATKTQLGQIAISPIQETALSTMTTTQAKFNIVQPSTKSLFTFTQTPILTDQATTTKTQTIQLTSPVLKDKELTTNVLRGSGTTIKTGTTSITTPKLALSSVFKTDELQKQQLRSKAITFRMITPRIAQPQIPITGAGSFIIFPPRVKADIGTAGGFSKIKVRQPTRYTPSYDAIINKVKGKAPKSKITLALGTRPITKGWTWFKKKKL